VCCHAWSLVKNTFTSITDRYNPTSSESNQPAARGFNTCHYVKSFEDLLLRDSHTTACRGRVVNTPASYSGGPGFKISARRPAILAEVFRGFFSVPSGECIDSALKLGYNRFLPNPFQFIIHLSSFHSSLYSLS
jgi:hypothetical protein